MHCRSSDDFKIGGWRWRGGLVVDLVVVVEWPARLEGRAQDFVGLEI